MNAPSSALVPLEDPLLFEEQLTGEERMVRDRHARTARTTYAARSSGAPAERFDREVFVEMGALGFLGSTLEAMAARA